MTSLGGRLAALREERGLTQTQVARAVGLSGNAFVSRLERGTVLPSPRLQRKLAALFGVSAALLRERVEIEATGAREQSLLDAVDAEVARLRERLGAEVDGLCGAFLEHRARLADTMRASRVQLLWSREQKISFEAGAREVWVVSPDLALDVGPLREVVAANLARGARYRYLVPDTAAARRRARDLPGGEVRTRPLDAWRFVLEVVLYEPRDPRRRLGLMVAPSPRAEMDCVLGPAHASRFAESFQRAWKMAAPCGLAPVAAWGSGKGSQSRRKS